MFGAFAFQPLPIRLFRQDLESYCPFLDSFKIDLGVFFHSKKKPPPEQEYSKHHKFPQVPTFGFQKLASKPNI